MQDGSVQIITSDSEPSLLLYAQDVTVSTAMTGGDPGQTMQLLGSGLHILLVDDLSILTAYAPTSSAMKGSQKWLVCPAFQSVNIQ